ncbi:integrase [Prescottella equi]|nr:integrase [Prescottella equi]
MTVVEPLEAGEIVMPDSVINLPLPSEDQVSDEDFNAGYSAAVKAANRAPGTHRTHESSWLHFESWCRQAGLDPLPASERTVLMYLHYWGDPGHERLPGQTLNSARTLEKKLAGIKFQHAIRGHAQPGEGSDRIRETLKLIRKRQRGTSTRGAAEALMIEDLDEAVLAMPNRTAIEIRNRALLTTLWWGAFRRSEVVSLDLADVQFIDDGPRDERGMKLHLPWSKTDQAGDGVTKPINLRRFDPLKPCPVLLLKEWIEVRGNAPGALFTNVMGNNGVKGSRLTGHTVNNVVKSAMARIGEDEARYSAHSTRSGLATTSSREGISIEKFAAQLAHRKLDTTRRYMQTGREMKDNVTQMIR